MDNPENILPKIQDLIIRQRKGIDAEENWKKFTEFIETNLDKVCKSLDTRWLVSICDTYVDYGDPVIRRNAMLVVQTANFEKLWATYLLMYDLNLNEEKVEKLKKNKVIPLWDGMYSFNINHGDMTNNYFARVDELMSETPVIEAIYKTVLQRIKENNTVLANLNKYHKRLFKPDKKRSVFRIIRKKVISVFKTYRI
jgi:hypothetical protein